MDSRFDAALLIGVDDYSTFDGYPNGPSALKNSVSDIQLIEGELIGAGCVPMDITRLEDFAMDREATRAKILVGLKNLARAAAAAGATRRRVFVGFAGHGGWDPLMGPYLCPADFRKAADTRRIYFAEIQAILDLYIPDLGVTFWFGGCHTALGAAPKAGVRFRTVTPAAAVPAGYPRLRPVDRVIAAATDAGWLDDAGPLRLRDPGVVPFGRPVEIDGGTTEFKGFDITDLSGNLLGTFDVTGPGYSPGSTNLSASSEHWYWSGTAWPENFRLVPNGSSPASIGTPFSRYIHQQFPTTDTNMPTIGTIPRAWQISRGTQGGTASPLGVVMTRANATAHIEWYALSSELNSFRLLACTASEMFEFKKITSNPSSMDGPPSPDLIRNISTDKQ